MAEVEIVKINKSYDGKNKVLNDLSLQIFAAERLFLLGPSGCGKSTLLRILAGLLEPDSGTVAFDGRDISHLPPEKRRASMVFQNYALWPHMTVFENIAFGLKNARVKKTDIIRQVDEVLDLVQLSGYGARSISSLSGGQQQRVALARALAMQPFLLLLDEPLSNLDAKLRDTMRSEICRICDQRQQTTLYVTHDRQEALSMADRMAVLQNGSIRQLDTPQEVYNHPCNKFCAEFLGLINLLPGRRNGKLWDCALGQIPAVNLFSSERELGAVRPEHIKICSPGTDNTIPGKLIKSTFLGESSLYQVDCGNTVLTVRENAGHDRRPGDAVGLYLEDGFFQIIPEE